MAAAGCMTIRPLAVFAGPAGPAGSAVPAGETGAAGLTGPDNAIAGGSILFELFRNPSSGYHPFVRWWWNGNKVETDELIRELHLLKAAGIGGVEINPVAFPSRSDGDDLGKTSLEWLSGKWCDMLNDVFAEAKKLDMTCDLIVGSGWPLRCRIH